MSRGAGIVCAIKSVDLNAADRFKPASLATPPDNRVPARADHDRVAGGQAGVAVRVRGDLDRPDWDAWHFLPAEFRARHGSECV